MLKSLLFIFPAFLLAAFSTAQAANPEVMSEMVKRRQNRVAMMPDTLQNPGFEDAATAGAMTGWTAMVHAGDSYRIEPDESQKFDGTRSLVIENTGDPEWGAAIQTIRAERFAGKEIELSARLKMEGVTAPGFFLLLRTSQMGHELGMVKTQGKLVGDAGWRVIRLRSLVPVETTHLEVNLTLQGDGRVWVDNVSIDVLESKK